MLTFAVAAADAALQVVTGFEIACFAASLGGDRTTVQIPATMAYLDIPPEERRQMSIGIEFTAYAIPFAFVLAAKLSITKPLPVAFMRSAKPATGGLYVYCKRVLVLVAA